MYGLGVDLGTTFSAAAVWRDGRAEICSLGTRTAAIPSVVLPRADGSFLTGESAVRRALVEPDRVAREFKRRLGDSTPLLLGGSPFSAEALTARLLAAVVTLVSAREGGPPGSVCVSHPANWGPFKTDLLRQAVRLADVRVPVVYTSEPEAAAVSYARQERLAAGDTVAVYDLGGGTFDAAVLRRTARGFEILGQPEGIERLGGVDIDAAVFSHVARSVGAALSGLDEDDPAAMAAMARLRVECTEAKEALSSDTDVTIPVLLPSTSTEVRLTRAELEDMVRPSLYDSIEALKRAVRSAGVEPADLSAVLLVGGSSRMPLVAQLVGSELGRPVAVDVHPKHAVALGAAWLASGAALPTEPTEPAARLATATPPVPRAAAPAPADVPAHAAAQPTVPLGASLLPPQPAYPPRPPAFAAQPDAIRRDPPAAPPGVAAAIPASPPRSATQRARALMVVVLVLAGVAVAGTGYWYLTLRDSTATVQDPGQDPGGAGIGTPTASAPPSSAGPTVSAAKTGAALTPGGGAQTTTLSVYLTGSGQVSGPGWCARSCTVTVPRGRQSVLHAEPAYGFAFTRWIGCARAAGPDCVVLPQHATLSVTVVFTARGDLPTTASTAGTRTATTTAPSTPPTTSPSDSGTATSVTPTRTTATTLDRSQAATGGATPY